MSDLMLTPRSYIYRLLSNFFAKELTTENIESIKSGDTARLMDALKEIEPYSTIINSLKEYFIKITDAKQAYFDLAESYAWLFHGVAGPQAAPLTASVYLSQNGNIRQEPEAELFKLMQSYGLSYKNYAKEPCDHLSVILEFVSWLNEQAETAEDPAPWTEEQKLVIEKYLLSWLPDFAARCRQGDRLGFYAALAENTLEFVTEDARQIKNGSSG
jgi:TorA-specific chaperone